MLTACWSDSWVVYNLWKSLGSEIPKWKHLLSSHPQIHCATSDLLTVWQNNSFTRGRQNIYIYKKIYIYIFVPLKNINDELIIILVSNCFLHLNKQLDDHIFSLASQIYVYTNFVIISFSFPVFSSSVCSARIFLLFFSQSTALIKHSSYDKADLTGESEWDLPSDVHCVTLWSLQLFSHILRL